MLASRSRDGELVTRYIAALRDRGGARLVDAGAAPRRSGTSRAGSKQGREVVVVPDGPRGPAEVVKPGIVGLARLSGAAIVPVAVGASSEWRLGSWDGFRIPRPFARCVARFGEPIHVRPGRRPPRGGGGARGGRGGAARAVLTVDHEARALMYALYSAMLALALAAYSPFFFLRRFGRGGYGHDFGQRLGRIEPGLPAEPRCWIHAVSVGEAAAAAPLVRGIRGRWPGSGHRRHHGHADRAPASWRESSAARRDAPLFPDRPAGSRAPRPRRGAAALLRRDGDGALAELPARPRIRAACRA